MKQLIYYPNKKHKLKNALFIESDCSKNYRVIVPISGTHLELYNEDRLIAEVDGSYITLNGNEILVKKLGFLKWGWVLPTPPAQCILVPSMGGDKYTIGDEVAVSLIDKTEISGNPFDLFKRVGDKERYLTLKYDKCMINEPMAYCLLMVNISKRLHTI